MNGGTVKRLAGPAFLANPSATNIYTPPAATIDTYITQISLANVTASAATATLYIGATGGSAAGTELMKGYSVPANSQYDRTFYPAIRMTSTDFLTGLSGTASAVTVTVLGYQRVV